MRKIKVEIDPEKVVKEMQKLMDLFISTKHDGFMESFPELYWRVYIPAKIAYDERRKKFSIIKKIIEEYPPFKGKIFGDEVLARFVVENSYEEKLISSICGCGAERITYEYNGQRIPLTLSFFERDDGELLAYVRIGNLMEFRGIVFDPHTGKRGIEALEEEFGRIALLRHFERVRKAWDKLGIKYDKNSER